ncbi:uncharacterized protein [Spinacia oleracea]|uniref:Reverse transcriptase Ty1/copia-type domain-containing protein n=1 Tax=Spinacia oleracea TaxID=3562 RepID=A0A9R0HUL4_SPIOL|nr:uncharacterized protein LOC110776792 [Spinacia oleracea]
MIATWGEATDSEEDEDQPEEKTANLCLMAKIDGSTQDPSSEEQRTRGSQGTQETKVTEESLNIIVAKFQPKPWKHQSSPPMDLIVNDTERGIQKRSQLRNFCTFHAFLSIIKTNNQKGIGLKWMYMIKLDKHGTIGRNRESLVVKGYNQQEGTNFEETFAPFARLETIRTLIVFVAFTEIKLYQMDVKCVSLNEYLEKDVYVEQPPGSENPEFSNHIYKREKALYGLRQATRSWYENII